MTGVRISSAGAGVRAIHEQHIACIAFSVELRSTKPTSITCSDLYCKKTCHGAENPQNAIDIWAAQATQDASLVAQSLPFPV